MSADIKQIEKMILGNMMLDENLNYNFVSVDDFKSYSYINRDLLLELQYLKNESKPVSQLYANTKYIELISECVDLGIITEAFEHNVNALRKINYTNELRVLGEKLSKVEVKQLNAAVKQMKNATEKFDSSSDVEKEKVVDLDKTPYKPVNTIGAYVPTGFDGLDEASNDLPTRQVSLVTGRSFEGKTTFVRQIIASAIQNGFRTLWVMGENYTQNEIERLYEFVIGNQEKYYETVKRNRMYKKIPKPEVVKALGKWHKGKLRIIHKSECGLKTTDQLFKLITREVKQYKPHLVVIDNLMSVLTASAAEKLEKQGEFVQNCCDLSKTCDTHIQIVLHPNKSYRKGDNLEYEHISGTMDIPNKADLIYVVRKNHEEEADCDGYIDLIKNKVESRTVTIRTHFDTTVNGLCELKDNGTVSMCKFNIEKYIDKTVKFYNGLEQTFENGELTKTEDDPF